MIKIEEIYLMNCYECDKIATMVLINQSGATLREYSCDDCLDIVRDAMIRYLELSKEETSTICNSCGQEPNYPEPLATCTKVWVGHCFDCHKKHTEEETSTEEEDHGLSCCHDKEGCDWCKDCTCFEEN